MLSGYAAYARVQTPPAVRCGDEQDATQVAASPQASEVGVGLVAETALRPLIAITTGDPAGIGPEVVLKALAHPSVYDRCRPVVIGDVRVLRRALAWLPNLNLSFNVVSQPEEGTYV